VAYHHSTTVPRLLKSDTDPDVCDVGVVGNVGSLGNSALAPSN
jgi:hypothetical protein